MTRTPIIEAVKVKKLLVTVQNVFRASFNDTYWLEEKIIELDEIDRDNLTWFDPYLGRSKINDTLIAIVYCSDEKLIILEKRNDTIKEVVASEISDCIFCEDYNEYMLLASHIRMKY